MIARRRAAGVLLLALLVGTVVLSARTAYQEWHRSDGRAEAEPVLAMIAERAAAAYARDGKLCGSSRVESERPYAFAMMPHRGRLARLEAEEARENVGYHCLGITPAAIGYGEDGFVYVASGDRFVVQAFRSWLFDPEGRLPRWERRGRVQGGKVEIDPEVYRREPGGPIFAGHEEREACPECETDAE